MVFEMCVYGICIVRVEVTLIERGWRLVAQDDDPSLYRGLAGLNVVLPMDVLLHAFA